MEHHVHNMFCFPSNKFYREEGGISKTTKPSVPMIFSCQVKPAAGLWTTFLLLAINKLTNTYISKSLWASIHEGFALSIWFGYYKPFLRSFKKDAHTDKPKSTRKCLFDVLSHMWDGVEIKLLFSNKEFNILYL